MSSLFHTAVSLVAAGALLFSGCSAAVLPKDVPAVKAPGTMPLDGVSLAIRNSEKDASAYPIGNAQGGVNPGLTADRRAWTKKLVEALAAELARRGAQVRVTASHTISMALPEITLSQNKETLRFAVTVHVSSSTGWSKKYDVSSVSEAGMFESSDAAANRGSGQLLAETVRAILNDDEFMLLLRNRRDR